MKLSKEFSKEDIQMAEKYLFYSLISLDIPEIQIKATLRFHLIPARQMVVLMWGKRDIYSLLLGVQTGTATMNASVQVIQEARNRSTM